MSRIGVLPYPVYRYTAANLIPTADPNKFTTNYPDGADTVMSVQPDGAIETRPAGTAGPYEVAVLTVAGDALMFGPYNRDFGQPPGYWFVPIVRF